MTKTRPILHHDGGVSLYAPTPTFASYRLVWRDPFTGGRPNRRFGDRASAEAAFEQAVAYVRGAASVAQKKGRRSGPPTVDELFTAVEERWLRDDTIEIPVQVQGKLRGRVSVPADADAEAMKAAAAADPRIAELIAGREIAKVVAVPGRLVNFVLK